LPLWVDDPDRVVRSLRRRGVEAMRWPGREQVPFVAAECPGTARWLGRSLILPLGCALTPARLAAVVHAVRDGVGVPAL
jgi:dTDP-4-amino-4,6-dideoxygalactose transaminase